MAKSQETSPLSFTFEKFGPGPFALVEPWLEAQASLITAMKGVSEHWYARRTADLAAVQKAASRLAGCTTVESFVAAQTQCAADMTDRFVADLTGLQQDVLAVSASATSALQPNGAPQKIKVA